MSKLDGIEEKIECLINRVDELSRLQECVDCCQDGLNRVVAESKMREAADVSAAGLQIADLKKALLRSTIRGARLEGYITRINEEDPGPTHRQYGPKIEAEFDDEVDPSLSSLLR